MSTFAHTHSANFAPSAPSRKIAQRPSLFSFGGLFSAISSAMDMANAIPDNGRVSAKQLARVRAIAKSI